MANEKSRNHNTKGKDGGASKHQGKPKDQTDSGSKSGKGAEGGQEGGGKQKSAS